MDPSYTGQHITRCDLCETSVVQKYCDICRVNLCISCVGIHISDEYDRHKVVPFSRRNSTLIYPPCKIHTSKRCKFRCDDCDVLLCSLCSSSSAHERHKHSNTFEVYRSKKELIKNDAEKLENNVLPACKEMEKDIEAHISNIDEAFERVILTVENHGKYWHKKIDFILREMKDNIGQIKKRQTEFLKKNLTKLQTLSSVLQKRILDLKYISKSNKISDAIAYSSNNELLKLPSEVKVTPPQFQPNLDEELTLDEFGTLTPGALSTEDQSYSMVKQDLPSSKHDKILLEKQNIIATLVTGTASSVANDNDENIWTSSYSNSFIQCHCMQSSISKQMASQSGQILRDITVNNEGDLLYISQKTLYRIKNGTTENVHIFFGWTPKNLCRTQTGDILVSMYSDDETQSRVVRYNGSTEKQTIQFDDDGEPLYSSNDCTKHICENGNGDICVADWRARDVVVVNQSGRLQFKYNRKEYKCEFSPFGIATDSHWHILTSDDTNRHIHVLDHFGQFLRYISNCELNNPKGLCIDNNDDLYVCEASLGVVKKIKYIHEGSWENIETPLEFAFLIGKFN